MRWISPLVAIVLITAVGCSSGGSDVVGGSALLASFDPGEPNPAAKSVAASGADATGDLLTLRVDVKDPGANVFGASFDVSFDAAHVEYVAWQAGTLLENGPGSVAYLVSPGDGQIQVGASLQGGSGAPVSGSATLIYLTFRVTQAGSTTLAFTNAALLDDQPPQPQPIPGLAWHGGTIRAD